MLINVGAHRRPPQNMAYYVELKLPKKKLIKKGHFDPPLCLPENRK